MHCPVPSSSSRTTYSALCPVNTAESNSHKISFLRDHISLLLCAVKTPETVSCTILPFPPSRPQNFLGWLCFWERDLRVGTRFPRLRVVLGEQGGSAEQGGKSRTWSAPRSMAIDESMVLFLVMGRVQERTVRYIALGTKAT